MCETKVHSIAAHDTDSKCAALLAIKAGAAVVCVFDYKILGCCWLSCKDPR